MSSSSECSSIYSTGGWLKFFSDAGVQQDVRAAYAASFMENRIERSMLKELNKDMLQDMGIKPIGDIILILRHIKELSNEEALEKMTTGMTSNVNVAKVRPQASVNVGDHSKSSVAPSERGDEPPESTVRPTVARMLRKVPRPQGPLQRNKNLQTTTVNHVLGNKQGVIKKNSVNIANIGKNTPSCTSQSTSLRIGINAKPKQLSSVNKTQNIVNLESGTVTKPRQLSVVRKTEIVRTVTSGNLQVCSRGIEQQLEDSNASTLSNKQETNTSSIQSTKISVVPIKKSVIRTTNTKKVSPEMKLVSKDVTKPVSESKIALAGDCAPGNSCSAGTLQTKSILKKSVSSLKMSSARNGQVATSTSGPTIVRNFKLRTESVDSNESLPAEDEAMDAEQASTVGSKNTNENSTVHNVGKKQRVVRRPIALPVVDTDDSDSLTNEESCGTHEQVSRGSNVNKNNIVQKIPVHKSNQRVGSCSTSGGTAEARIGCNVDANMSRSATQKTNLVSLRSVNHNSECVVPPASKIRRLPPEYEGNYTVIMPKGWVPNKVPAWKENKTGVHISNYSEIAGYSNETENVLYEEQGEEDDYVEEEEEENYAGNEEELGVVEINKFEEELDEELYGQYGEEIDDYGQPGTNDYVKPQEKATSVFDRLGWPAEEDGFDETVGCFERAPNSIRNVQNSKSASVFSRLGIIGSRRVFNEPYQVRYVRNIRQRAYNTLRKKSYSPETQMCSRPFVVKKKGPASHQFVKKKRQNIPAESSNSELPSSQANRKIVRFGVKEELHFDTPEDDENDDDEEAPHPPFPRKPLPGSITLRTGIFNKLGT